MNLLRGGILLAIAGLAVLVIVAVFSRKPAPQNVAPPRDEVVKTTITEPQTPASNTPGPAKPSPTPQRFAKLAADFTEAERAKLAKDFTERYKPVLEKWFNAYEGRIPFRLEDFTLDKFHSRFGDYAYTFIIGDATLTIGDNPKLRLMVDYLMTRQGSRQLNQIPKNGFVRDLSVPVTREEVLRMVKADTGVEFKPNEVLIKPTAAACALNGGAFVYIMPEGADPEYLTNAKVSMVLDADGKLVHYGRDPLF